MSEPACAVARFYLLFLRYIRQRRNRRGGLAHPRHDFFYFRERFLRLIAYGRHYVYGLILIEKRFEPHYDRAEERLAEVSAARPNSVLAVPRALHDPFLDVRQFYAEK